MNLQLWNLGHTSYSQSLLFAWVGRVSQWSRLTKPWDLSPPISYRHFCLQLAGGLFFHKNNKKNCFPFLFFFFFYSKCIDELSMWPGPWKAKILEKWETHWKSPMRWQCLSPEAFAKSQTQRVRVENREAEQIMNDSWQERESGLGVLGGEGLKLRVTKLSGTSDEILKGECTEETHV